MEQTFHQAFKQMNSFHPHCHSARSVYESYLANGETKAQRNGGRERYSKLTNSKWYSRDPNPRPSYPNPGWSHFCSELTEWTTRITLFVDIGIWEDCKPKPGINSVWRVHSHLSGKRDGKSWGSDSGPDFASHGDKGYSSCCPHPTGGSWGSSVTERHQRSSGKCSSWESPVSTSEVSTPRA